MIKLLGFNVQEKTTNNSEKTVPIHSVTLLNVLKKLDIEIIFLFLKSCEKTDVQNNVPVFRLTLAWSGRNQINGNKYGN